jgi:predicted acyl esterase
VPALVCAGWSDHGLHTRGSLEGYGRIASKERWLFTHGRRKWETFYSSEAREPKRMNVILIRSGNLSLPTASPTSRPVPAARRAA